MTDNYDVHITRCAYNQMYGIRQYIAEELLAPDSARNILFTFREAIMSLQVMPYRHQLVDEEPWRSEGVRYFLVHNFYIYYWVDENKNRVNITAVIYGRRNQVKQLKKMDLE